VVLFDTNFILAFFNEIKDPIIDKASRDPIEYIDQRVVALVERLQKEQNTIGIPTPALAEYGIRSGRSTQEIFKIISQSPRIEVLPFDQKAALECAIMARAGYEKKNKRYDANPNAVYQKLKIDRQIVAIAKACCVTDVYSHDSDVRILCGYHGIPCHNFLDLPIPDSARQMELPITNKRKKSKPKPKATDKAPQSS